MNFQEAVALYVQNPAKENLADLAEKLCNEMTTNEKIKMLQGHAMSATVKNVFRYARYYNATPYKAGGCKRLGIPEVRFTDGPRGVVMGKSTCFPVSMLRGAAFDDDLEYRIGEAIAKESLAQGANYFAGICINLLRHPAWGRAQETYGEDPYLLGRMGVALTKAVQNYGVMACPKHYALNSIEDLRFSVDAIADDETLRDVYLPHFKKCIDAGALSIMAAYNKVNGTYSCDSKELLTDILRNEWGFDGFAISDFFFGIHDAAQALNAGLDIEMPYTFKYASLSILLKTGKVSMETVNLSVQRILRALIANEPNTKPQPESVVLCTEHRALAREAAQKGITLLKNKENCLPIAENKSVAVIGRYADKVNVGDHGSSNVYSPYTVTPYKGLLRRFGTENVKLYNGCDIDKALELANSSDYAVVCVGSDYLQEGEFLVNLGEVKKKPQGAGGDRVSLRIPLEDIALIRTVAQSKAKLIVNIMGGSAYVIDEWDNLADSIVFSYYSGLEGGTALADILSGDVNPSGRLPFTIAKNEKDYPEFRRIGDDTKEIRYGYYHGYTLFEKESITPAYPFGFGLSYTDYSLSRVKAEYKNGEIKVHFAVTNKGDMAGECPVQIYASSTKEDRPVKLLKGFKRVYTEPGQTKKATVTIPVSDLAFYNAQTKEYAADESYIFHVGLSSAATKASAVVEVK